LTAPIVNVGVPPGSRRDVPPHRRGSARYPGGVSIYLDLANLTGESRTADEGGAMEDTGKTREKSEAGRSSYRKVWWMRFLLPPIALIAWGYFATTALSAYHFRNEGVVVSGEVTRTESARRADYMVVRFTTSDGTPVETTVVPKSCEVKQPGESVKVRYLPSDPETAQDSCDVVHSRLSWPALLMAIATTAISVQAWRLWRRHRRTGHIPPEDFA
jgi:hypothetical protein